MGTVYLFRGGIHYIKFHISSDRNLKLASEKTGFKFVVLEKFWKPDDVERFKKLIADMDDVEFDKYVIKEFAGQGYRLISKKLVEDGGLA